MPHLGFLHADLTLCTHAFKQIITPARAATSLFSTHHHPRQSRYQPLLVNEALSYRQHYNPARLIKNADYLNQIKMF